MGRQAHTVERAEERALKALQGMGIAWEGQGILAAVSGGADSVALLRCLHALRPRLGFRLYAAHLDHGIRGEEARQDAEFVQALCQALGVACHVGRADVPALAAAQGLSLETAARQARYAFLEEAMAHFGAQWAALAHHGDDQAETLLLHLFRGSGGRGLCGMEARRGPYIRPFLGLGRQALEEYLKGLGQPWRTDATNLSPDTGLRNRLRLELLPWLAAHVNPRVSSALCRTAELLQADEDYLSAAARQALEEARLAQGFDREKLASLHPALGSRALGLALAEAGAGQDISQRHIQLLSALLSGPTGAHLDLPGVKADISYGALLLTPAAQAPATPAFCLPLQLTGLTPTPLGDFLAGDYAGPLLRDPYTALMDRDKLPPGPLEARTRRPGDRFYPLGAPGRKKLKDFYIDKKAPRALRQGPGIFQGAEALFLPGFGISERVKVDGGTRRILRVEYIPYEK